MTPAGGEYLKQIRAERQMPKIALVLREQL